MENKLQTSEATVLQPTGKHTNITLPGDNNTLIAHADTVKNEYNSSIVVLTGGQTTDTTRTVGVVQEFNSDYYNLIVVGEDDLATDHFLVRKDRALTENTTPEIKNSCAALTEEAIARVKSFPALIATENHNYGKTDEAHYAIYGMISEVKVQDNGIKINYQILNRVPQQRLNELAPDLGLGRVSCINELNRMHWAIKKINLVEVLRDAGIRVFALA